MEYLDQFCLLVSQITQVHPQEIKFVASLFTCIPAGFVLKGIHSPLSRQLFSLSFGLFIQYFIFRFDTIYSLMGTVINYLFLVSLKGRSVGPCFVFSMVLLWSFHLRSMYKNYAGWSLDINVSLMINALKCTSISFNVRDALVPQKELSSYQKAFAVPKMPSLLEYFTYIYFYPTSMCGPFVEYKDFYMYMYKEGRYANIPSSLRPTLNTLGIALICLTYYSLFNGVFSLETILTKWFSDLDIFTKMIYLTLVSFRVFYFKYATGFLLTETACRSCGISYNINRNTKEVEWDYLKNIDMDLCYLNEYAHNHSSKWNITVGKWMKRYVYVRGLSLGLPKSLCFFGTFFCSCFWHGFYPGYYYAFLQWALAQFTSYIAKDILERTIGVNGKGNIKVPVWVRVVSMVPYQFMLIVCMLPFHFKTVERAIQAMSIFPIWLLGLNFATFPLALGIQKFLRMREKARVKQLKNEENRVSGDQKKKE